MLLVCFLNTDMRQWVIGKQPSESRVIKHFVYMLRGSIFPMRNTEEAHNAVYMNRTMSLPAIKSEACFEKVWKLFFVYSRLAASHFAVHVVAVDFPCESVSAASSEQMSLLLDSRARAAMFPAKSTRCHAADTTRQQPCGSPRGAHHRGPTAVS